MNTGAWVLFTVQGSPQVPETPLPPSAEETAASPAQSLTSLGVVTFGLMRFYSIIIIGPC